MTLIAALDYKQLCDEIYEGKGKCKSGVVYCSTEHLKKFFDTHSKLDSKYVLVSGCCDYGVCLQSERPVAGDFSAGLAMMDLSCYDGYTSIVIPPRCNLNLCNKHDKYSVKCYAFTHSTFNKIPDNVKKWFLVNANIDDEVVEYLPLGLYPEGATEEFEKAKISDQRDFMMYANWTNYTMDRLHLKSYLKQFGWCVVDDGRRPFKEFLEYISKFKYILCPEGNGLDSHRIWESIYMGCIPVMLRNRFSENLMAGLPKLLIDDWTELTYEFLHTHWNKIKDLPRDITKATLEYWKDKINDSRTLLC